MDTLKINEYTEKAMTYKVLKTSIIAIMVCLFSSCKSLLPVLSGLSSGLATMRSTGSTTTVTTNNHASNQRTMTSYSNTAQPTTTTSQYSTSVTQQKTSSSRVCPRCNGSGYYRIKSTVFSSTETIKKKCSYCGSYYDISVGHSCKCTKCGGLGRINR